MPATITELPAREIPATPEAARVKKPNRRPGSCPSPVTQLRPAPDPDTPAVARWLHRHGWAALDAFHAGFDADVCAALWMLETSPPCLTS